LNDWKVLILEIGFEELKSSQNIDFGRGRGKDRKDTDGFEPDGEEVKENLVKYDDIDEEESIGEVINGDDLPDDYDGFDYDQAVRDSVDTPLEIEESQDIEIEMQRLSISESKEYFGFWTGAPEGWQDMENEELEEIGLIHGKCYNYK
jgi:hypothetical protein